MGLRSQDEKIPRVKSRRERERDIWTHRSETAEDGSLRGGRGSGQDGHGQQGGATRLTTDFRTVARDVSPEVPS